MSRLNQPPNEDEFIQVQEKRRYSQNSSKNNDHYRHRGSDYFDARGLQQGSRSRQISRDHFHGEDERTFSRDPGYDSSRRSRKEERTVDDFFYGERVKQSEMGC